MIAFKRLLLPVTFTELLTEVRTHRPAEMAVNFFQGRLRITSQSAIIDTVVAPRIDLLSKREEMLKPPHRQLRIRLRLGSVFPQERRMLFPDRPKDADVGSNC